MNILLSLGSGFNQLCLVLLLFSQFQYFPHTFEFRLKKAYLGRVYDFGPLLHKPPFKFSIPIKYQAIFIYNGVKRIFYRPFIVDSDFKPDIKALRPLMHYELKINEIFPGGFFSGESEYVTILSRKILNYQGELSIGTETQFISSTLLPKMSLVKEWWITESQTVEAFEKGKWYCDLRDHKTYSYLKNPSDPEMDLIIERAQDGGIVSIVLGRNKVKDWWVEACPRNKRLIERLRRRP